MSSAFANSFDPDQERQYVGPDLEPNCVTLFRLMVILKDPFEKVNFEYENPLTVELPKFCSHNLRISLYMQKSNK